MNRVRTYNDLIGLAYEAINAKSWRIAPQQLLDGEPEQILRALAEENNRRLHDIEQKNAGGELPAPLARHHLEALEIAAAFLAGKAKAHGLEAQIPIEWPNWREVKGVEDPAPIKAGGRRQPFPPITCKTLGRLDAGRRVIGRIGSINKRGVVLCKCSCGRDFLAFESNVEKGGAKYCGPDCPSRAPKTRRTGSKLYAVFMHMRERCNNPQHPDYARYGGRGIRICREWDSFDAFAAWAVNSGYAEGLTIDRIDNDGGYSPDNCRWATRSVQNNNRSTCIMVEYAGQRMTLKQAATAAGLPYSALLERYHTHGERDLFRPLQKHRKRR